MTNTPSRTRYALFALFILYALAILFVLIVPNSYRIHSVFVDGLTKERWFDYVSRNINLVPLRGIVEQLASIFDGQHAARNLIYLVGNVVGFMPLGFFLPALFVRQRRFSQFLLTVLGSTAALELIQVVTMRGSFDVDDIILNTAGACLGFAIMRKRLLRVAGLPAGRRRCVR